jgi:hypothetical protein
MFDITINRIFQFILLILLILSALFSHGQGSEKSRSIRLELGGGLGHYFNTFTNVLDEDVKNNRPSFCGKILWQPEYRLSLGIESGYYFMYSTTRIQTDIGAEKLTSRLKVVPLFLSLSMRVVNHLNINFGTGLADMIYTLNAAKTKSDKVVGTTYSMSNYTTGFTYSYQLGKKISLGAEFKYLYLRKTDDSHVSLLVNISYNILKWRIK